ncbi:MAG: hypothetical protein ACXW18_09750 [Pyrinomonadaceae bacterium]
MKKLMTSLLVVVALLGMACGFNSNKVSYDESTDGLKKLMSDIYEAQKSGDKDKMSRLMKSLELPDADAWFKKVFGADVGARVAAQHKTISGSLNSDLERIFAKVVNDGQSEIRITRLEKADDPNANGNQRDVLAAMKEPVPLYSVRFVKPGETAGMHLYNYVYVDGTFRVAGKMDAVRG